MGINQVDNAAEYATLLKENGLGDNTVMNYGNNTDGANGFYSQKDNLIGLNLLNSNGTTQSAKDVENTTWHEIAHANDSTNKNTQDRESFASSVGSAGSGMASVNNFFYGNGGLTDSSVATYYNTNKNSSAMQQNNTIASVLHATNQREDSSYLVSREIGATKLGLGNHNFIVTTGTKEDLESIVDYKVTNHILPLKGEIIYNSTEKLEYDLTDTFKDRQEGEDYFIINGGYNSKDVGSYGLESGIGLEHDLNNTSDLYPLWQEGVGLNLNQLPITNVKKIEFNNNKTTLENDKAIVGNFHSISNFNPSIPYDPYVLMGGVKGYNSNSLTYSACTYAGGSNCSTNTFGGQTLIPTSYFIFDSNNTKKEREKIEKKIQQDRIKINK